MCEPGLTAGEVGWRPYLLLGSWLGNFLPHQPGFPSHTSKKADVVLLCGDLNLHPKDVGCRLLKEWTGLQDAYLETRDFKVRACLPLSPLHPSFSPIQSHPNITSPFP